MLFLNIFISFFYMRSNSSCVPIRLLPLIFVNFKSIKNNKTAQKTPRFRSWSRRQPGFCTKLLRTPSSVRTSFPRGLSP